VNLATADVTGVLPLTNLPTIPIDTKTDGLLDLATRVTGTLPAANGGASSPTGTGFMHVTGSARDGAARAVDLSTADVTGALPVASVSGFNAACDARITANIPTGTGFSHITGSARDSVARAIDLNSADVTGLLAPARGGGTTRTDFDTFVTTDASVVTVATSRAIPTPGVADVLASVVAHDATGATYRVDLTLLVQRNSDGSYSTDVAETPNGEYTGLLGVAAHLSLSSNTIVFTCTGKAGTTITWVEPYFSATVG
jgi:hypothetical protein